MPFFTDSRLGPRRRRVRRCRFGAINPYKSYARYKRDFGPRGFAADSG